MKKIIFLSFIVLIFFINNQNIFPQVQQQWLRTYNGNANSDDGVSKVTTDKQGNIYVVGFATRTGTNRDFLTIKYNPFGDTLWTRYYAGPATQFAYDQIFDIALDDSNNVYVFGSSAGTNTTSDFVTIKYNSSGTQQWLSRYSVGPNTQLLAVAMKRDQQGNIYVTGWQGSSVAPGVAYLLKYNSNGVQQWIRTLRTDGENDVSAMALDNVSNIYLAGNGSALEESSFYAARFNSNGDSLWCSSKHQYGMYGGIGINDLKVDQNGNAIVCGTIDNWYYLQDHYYMLTVKYNSSGVQQWYNTYPQNDTGGARGYCVVIDNNCNIYSSGTYQGSATVKYNNSGAFQWRASLPNTTIIDSQMDTLNNLYAAGYQFVSPNTQKYLSMKINPAGSIIWSVSYVDSLGRYGSVESLSLDNNLNVIVTGTVGGMGYTSDIVTIKYNQLVGIKPMSNIIPDKFSLSQNFPNPFNPSTAINYKIPVTNYVSLAIYDLLGREVAVLVNEKQQAGEYQVTWDASNFASGIYFYKLVSENFIETKRMVLVK